MVFFIAEMAAHDDHQGVHHSMYLVVSQPWGKHCAEAFIAIQLEKADQGLFVQLSIESEIHILYRLNQNARSAVGQKQPTQCALAWAVKFTEKDALPGAELYVTLVDDERNTGANQTGHHMCG